MLQNLRFRKISLLLIIMLINAGYAAAQWSAVRFDSTNIFHKVFAVSSNSAFVIGTQPVTSEYFMLRTNDGGDNWDWLTLNTATDTFELISLHFTDPNNGFAGGGKNNFQTLLKTSDNGNTWTEISPNPSSANYISSVYFISPQIGFASDGTDLYKTVDGGATWATITTAFMIEDLHFFTTSDGIITGNDGSMNAVVMKTTDGGQTWNTLLSAHDANLFVSSFIKIDVVSPTTFFTSMGNTRNLYRTLNAGLTWDTIAVDSVDVVGDFDFITPDVGHILGIFTSMNEYKLLVTADAGQNSTLLYTTGWNFYGGGVVLNSISFPGETGFAAASHGLIKKYTSSVTSIEENNGEDFVIHPNPASSFLNIKTANISQVEIRDMLGKLIFVLTAEDLNAGTLVVNVQELNEGIYIVRAHKNGKISSARFIKQ